MFLKVLHITFFLLFFSTQIKASDNQELFWSLEFGLAFIYYPEELADNINEFKKLEGITKTSVCAVLPGVYLDIYENQLYAGIRLGTAFERYASDVTGNELSTHTLIISLFPSLLYNFSGQNDDFFAECGAGTSFIYYTNSNHILDFEKLGFSTAGGIGYSMPLGTLKLRFVLDYSMSFMDTGRYDILCIRAGVAF